MGKQIELLALPSNMFEDVHRLEVVILVLCLLIIPNINIFFKVNEINQTFAHRKLVREVCEEGEKDVVFRAKTGRRSLSIAYPNGTCEYTPGNPFIGGDDHDGVLIAGYPASGVRLTWMHIEGLTEIIVGDDFDCQTYETERKGIIKTQYPHIEGLWSWDDNMKDVALLVRNPRFALPSYHSLISEIHYAHDCETAVKHQSNLFTTYPSVLNWTKWRDYRFNEELNLWRWFIDFWMENGTKYWMDLDYERNGQFPFAWVPEGDRGRDMNCLHQNIDCVPKVVVAYEYINDPVHGHIEMNKLAEFMEGRQGINVIEESARPCIFNATLHSSPYSYNEDRIGEIGEFNFTYPQLVEMLEIVNGVKSKYSSGPWVGHPVATELARYMSLYAVDIGKAILDIEITQNYPPTTAPHEDYHRILSDWYDGIGRGNRYNKDRIRAMNGFWPKVAHLYPDDDT